MSGDFSAKALICLEPVADSGPPAISGDPIEYLGGLHGREGKDQHAIASWWMRVGAGER